MTRDFSIWHLRTYRAGEPGYYSSEKQQTVTIEQDSRRYTYDAELIRHDLRAFKLWAASAFGHRITGKFPNYRAD